MIYTFGLFLKKKERKENIKENVSLIKVFEIAMDLSTFVHEIHFFEYYFIAGIKAENYFL